MEMRCESLFKPCCSSLCLYFWMEASILDNLWTRSEPHVSTLLHQTASKAGHLGSNALLGLRCHLPAAVELSQEALPQALLPAGVAP